MPAHSSIPYRVPHANKPMSAWMDALHIQARLPRSPKRGLACGSKVSLRVRSPPRSRMRQAGLSAGNECRAVQQKEPHVGGFVGHILNVVVLEVTERVRDVEDSQEKEEEEEGSGRKFDAGACIRC